MNKPVYFRNLYMRLYVDICLSIWFFEIKNKRHLLFKSILFYALRAIMFNIKIILKFKIT